MTARSIYRAARIFDGSELVEGPIDVVVAGELISSVGKPAAEDDPTTRVVELGDSTIMPGLIDAHVHLGWSATARPEHDVASSSTSITAMRALLNAQQHLRHGVTLVRDVGTADGHAVAIAALAEQRAIVAPHVVAAGYAIAMTGGHVAGHIAREADGVAEIRKAVRREVRDGARCIKLMTSGGLLGGEHEQPGAVELDFDELVTAVKEAKKLGCTVAAHAHSDAAISNAIAAGVDSIEHASMIEPRTAARLAASETVVVPTLSAIDALHASSEELHLPPHVAARARGALQKWHDSTTLAIRSGVAIVAGTDAGVPGQPHGHLARELEALSAAGLPILDVLRSCTSRAAKLLGRSDYFGYLRPGLRADLAVFPGSPLTDLSSLREPSLVVLGGRPVPRE